jgi:hypothetical protein
LAADSSVTPVQVPGEIAGSEVRAVANGQV